MRNWIISTRCDSNACLAVSPGSTRVWVADTTQPGVILSVAREDFAALLEAVKAGRLHR